MAADHFDLSKALHGDLIGRGGLISSLRLIPAEHREEAIAAAIKEIDEAERRNALKSKFGDLSTDEMERLLGEVRS